MFKYFVVVLFFTLANLAFSSENNLPEPDSSKKSVDAAWLTNGYYDILNFHRNPNYSFHSGDAFSSKDSIDGIYLYAEGDWEGPCCTSPYYTRLTIGKNMEHDAKDNIWVIADSLDLDSLNSELKKGKPLSLENFKKMEFDSLHSKYIVDATHSDEIEYRIQGFGNIGFFILYQNEQLTSALCGISSGTCAFEIACFYQYNGSLSFDSIPNPNDLIVSSDCKDNVRPSSLPVNRNFKKQNSLDKLYKVNGAPASKNSSNIVIQNKKQPKLKLKGNRYSFGD